MSYYNQGHGREMNIFQSASHSSGAAYAPPISTGVPLSERFKGLQQSKGPVLAKGGYGYGYSAPPMVPSFFPQQQQHFGSNDYSSQNKALAAALNRRTQALILKSRLMGKARMMGGGYHHMTTPVINKGPVSSRIGFPQRYNTNAVRLARGHGGIVKKAGLVISGGRRGINRGRGGNNSFVRNNTSGAIGMKQRSGVVVARGGGRGRGNGGRQGGRGGAMNANGWFGAHRSKEALDKELDVYMSKSKTKVKIDLDKDLEEYMKEARAQSLASLGITASSNNTVVIEDADVSMKDVSI